MASKLSVFYQDCGLCLRQFGTKSAEIDHFARTCVMQAFVSCFPGNPGPGVC